MSRLDMRGGMRSAVSAGRVGRRGVWSTELSPTKVLTEEVRERDCGGSRFRMVGEEEVEWSALDDEDERLELETGREEGAESGKVSR
jgi:hypothetical protein